MDLTGLSFILSERLDQHNQFASFGGGRVAHSGAEVSRKEAVVVVPGHNNICGRVVQGDPQGPLCLCPPWVDVAASRIPYRTSRTMRRKNITGLVQSGIMYA